MEKKMMFIVTDGDQYTYDSVEMALEHIRQSVVAPFAPLQEGYTFEIEIAFLTQAQYDALPEQ